MIFFFIIVKIKFLTVNQTHTYKQLLYINLQLKSYTDVKAKNKVYKKKLHQTFFENLVEALSFGSKCC